MQLLDLGIAPGPGDGLGKLNGLDGFLGIGIEVHIRSPFIRSVVFSTLIIRVLILCAFILYPFPGKVKVIRKNSQNRHNCFDTASYIFNKQPIDFLKVFGYYVHTNNRETASTS